MAASGAKIGDPGARGAPEGYLGWAHGVALLACVGLAIWSFPTDRELSNLLQAGELGSAALAEAERRLANLPADAGALDRAKALRQLGIALGVSGRIDEMRAQLQKAVDLAPGWIAGRLTLADAERRLALPHLEMPLLAETFRQAREVARLSPESARDALADFELAPGQVPPGWRELPDAVARALLPWRRRAALELDYEGHASEAIDQYRRALVSDPADVRTAIRLIQLLVQEGRDGEGREALARFLQRLDATGQEVVLLQPLLGRLSGGGVKHLLREILAGARLRRRSIDETGSPPAAPAGPSQDQKDEAAILEGLRHAVILARRPKKLLEGMERSLLRWPNDARIRLQYAQALEDAGDYESAVREYLKLRELERRPDARIEDILRLLRWDGRLDEVTAELGGLYGATRSVSHGLELARHLQWTEKNTESLEVYRDLARENPDDIAVLAGLAGRLRALERHREAIPVLERLLRKLDTGKASARPSSATVDVAVPAAAAATPGTGTEPPAATGPGASPEPRLIRRRVLALFKSSEESEAYNTRLHKFAELAFDRIGFLVDYRDVEQALPDAAEMEPYAGIVTWFDQPAMRQAREFLVWLHRQGAAGRKLVMLGGLGALADSGTGKALPLPLVNRVMSHLGLEHSGGFFASDPDFTVRGTVSPLIEFERKLGRERPAFEPVLSIDEANRVLLSLERTDETTRSAGDVAVLAPGGLYATAGCTARVDPTGYRRHLRLDLFTIVEELFGGTRQPVPDPSTVNGLRTAVIHVDGDGAENGTTIKGYTNCLEALTERIYRRYPMEATVSFIGTQVDPGWPGTREVRRLARELYELPWIEPASHSYSHPFDWRNPVSGATMAEQHGAVYGLMKFELEREMRDSTSLMLSLAPDRKVEPILLWSGSCNPTESQLESAASWGILTLNGGDGRCDGLFDSVAHLSPWTRPIGRHRQILTAHANEFYLTEAGAEPNWTFRKLEQSWDRSGSPRRLKPMGLYYHHYLARSEDGLATLEQLTRRILEAPVAVVPASEFIHQVRGYQTVKLHARAPGRFLVRDAGRCLALRSARPLGLPDVDASRGVAGYLEENGECWTHLAPGDEQEIVYSPSPPAPRLRLVSANVRLTGWDRTEDSVTGRFRGFGKARIVVAGRWIDGGARVHLHDQDDAALAVDSARRPDGSWSLEADIAGDVRLEIRPEGHAR